MLWEKKGKTKNYLKFKQIKVNLPPRSLKKDPS